ncbi:ATP-binding protein [Methanobrevibacter curvatus]|uniref:Putative AAA-ATPase n=1 Tax=Methanobrevibacter curvatus TaxID=49547 RepID=A0A166APW0_9EURY|nr:ATP-binding protein [Methanobrevibacter curvatus]KZX12318.1 putative AAA-ATPase [Methanobrevibacter curvatus]
MKKLPKGIATFSELIEEDYIYIDKTKDVYEMIKNGKLNFLSRPRRFGKSLLVSTLEELFKGNKELFKGLYIYDKWEWNENYPVLRIDFTQISHENPEILKKSLNEYLDRIANDFSIKLDNDIFVNKFGSLINYIYATTGKKVVVLIDEYDKAINNHLDDIDIAEENRNVLKEFYQVLKGSDRYIRFLFLTGISKFAKTSIFSDLNHVEDITINPKFSTICGYTQEDLETHFNEYLFNLSNDTKMSYEKLIKAIKNCYNGYSWDGMNFVYNPFSILNLFSSGEFLNYWSDSGTPELLVDILKNTDADLNVLAKKKSEFVGSFPNFELNNMDFDTVLLQTGYLTIQKKEISPPKPPLYTTAIPNKEVEDSLFSYILGIYTNYSAEKVEPLTRSMLKYIYNQDSEGLQKSFEVLLHKIPNLIYGELKREIEAHYKILAISWLQLLGFDIESEIMTLKGRLDAMVKHKDFYMIVEFKFSDKKSFQKMFDEAENQIIEKGYYKPYQNKKIIVLSIAFKPRDVKCQFKTVEETLKKYNK